MTRVLLVGLVWLFAAGTAGPAAANTDERVVLSYELWKGGFHALDLQAGLRRGGETYSVDFAVRSRGVIGWIYPYLLEGAADGKLDGGGPRPSRFASLAQSRGDERRRAISYLADGTLRTWSDPPRTVGEDEEAVPESMRRDTLDPASAILAVIDAVARTGRCDGDYPVYDGRRRYDLSVSLVGESPLAPSRYTAYSGPATLCRVTVEKLSGFRDMAKKGGMPDIIDIWLASIAGANSPLPVRLEGQSDLGSLVIHLVDVKRESKPGTAAPPRSAAH